MLRAIGCTVAITSSVGGGFPDLVVGYKGQNFLFEVKDGLLPPSRTRLTPAEQEFSESWRGSYHVVTGEDEAVRIVLGMDK